ncbi:MAG TPA: hypothetical protein DCQ68_07480 [Chryseobacterium indologenes]|nr:hypothetical protein [Chryseobacterium indologenes]
MSVLFLYFYPFYTTFIMKIQIISDLHREFGQTELCFDHSDAVVFTGDMSLGINGVEWIKTKIPNKPVTYVLRSIALLAEDANKVKLNLLRL